MRPDHQEFTDGVKLATIAVLSAVLTATVVIGAGRVLLPKADPVAEAQVQPDPHPLALGHPARDRTYARPIEV